MKKVEIKEILDRASVEVNTWPDWMRSPDVEAGREKLKMHPEDRKYMKEGKAYAEKYAMKFCVENLEEIFKIISTYEDNKAEGIFNGLREKFWTRSWEYKNK